MQELRLITTHRQFCAQFYMTPFPSQEPPKGKEIIGVTCTTLFVLYRIGST